MIGGLDPEAPQIAGAVMLYDASVVWTTVFSVKLTVAIDIPIYSHRS